MIAYYFEMPVRAAVARNAKREGRARVPNVAIFSTQKKLVPPAAEEGFDEIHIIRIESGSMRIERPALIQGLNQTILFLRHTEDDFFQNFLVKQVYDSNSPATCFVFVSRTDAARGGADLFFAAGLLGRLLHNPMIRQNKVSPVTDEEIALDLDAGVLQRLNLFQKRLGIQHDALSNDTNFIAMQDSGRD